MGKEFRAALLEVCPSLTDHRCRSDSVETEPLDARDLGEICGRRLKDDPVDIAHLLEHMVIDLVVEISGNDRCSGVTCGLHDPKNRFHVPTLQADVPKDQRDFVNSLPPTARICPSV